MLLSNTIPRKSKSPENSIQSKYSSQKSIILSIDCCSGSSEIRTIAYKTQSNLAERNFRMQSKYHSWAQKSSFPTRFARLPSGVRADFWLKIVNWNLLAIAKLGSAIAALLIGACVKKPKLNRSLVQWGAALAYAMTVILKMVATKLGRLQPMLVLLQYTAPVYGAISFAWFILGGKGRLGFDWLTIVIVLFRDGFIFQKKSWRPVSSGATSWLF